TEHRVSRQDRLSQDCVGAREVTPHEVGVGWLLGKRSAHSSWLPPRTWWLSGERSGSERACSNLASRARYTPPMPPPPSGPSTSHEPRRVPMETFTGFGISVYFSPSATKRSERMRT